MPVTALLTPEEAPLTRLSLYRIQLTPAEPAVRIEIGWDEVVLYPLAGAMQLIEHDSGFIMGDISRPGTIRDTPVNICRIPVSSARRIYTCRLLSDTADVLVLSSTAPNEPAQPYQSLNDMPALLQTVLDAHDVGMGTHARLVREWQTPPGYMLHVGETLNAPGAWSSWPAHATLQQAETDYALHEEVFFVITPGYGIMHMQGRYCTGEAASGVRLIENGQALVTPLGNHPIVFAPDSWGWYFWGYYSLALSKPCNQWATDIKN